MNVKMKKVFLSLVFLWVLCSGDCQAFQTEYFVTGLNTTTNERVVGWLENFDSSPYVCGYVLERTGRTRVTGHFSGRGQFRLESLTHVYDVEVADEVTSDKIKNRQNN